MDSTFENEMRLIGYYNKPNQTMHAETEFVEEAACLAERLKISFDSLRNNATTDVIFKSILNSNAVFVLKDKKDKLYAYFPSKNMTRISGVVYNKKHVIPIPLKYKSWFVAGEDVIKRYVVGRKGNDFMITDSSRNVTFALDWDSDDYMSFQEMSDFVNDNWISLY